MATMFEAVTCIRTDFIGETCADAMQDATRYISKSDRPITDVFVGVSKNFEPMVSVYEELRVTDANVRANQIADEVTGDFGSSHTALNHNLRRDLRDKLVDAILQPLKGVK